MHGEKGAPGAARFEWGATGSNAVGKQALSFYNVERKRQCWLKRVARRQAVIGDSEGGPCKRSSLCGRRQNRLQCGYMVMGVFWVGEWVRATVGDVCSRTITLGRTPA